MSNELLEYAIAVCLSPPCPKKEHKKSIIANQMIVSQLPSLSFRSNAYFGESEVGFNQTEQSPSSKHAGIEYIRPRQENKAETYLLKLEIKVRTSYARCLKTDFHCLDSYNYKCNNAYN